MRSSRQLLATERRVWRDTRISGFVEAMKEIAQGLPGARGRDDLGKLGFKLLPFALLVSSFWLSIDEPNAYA